MLLASLLRQSVKIREIARGFAAAVKLSLKRLNKYIAAKLYPAKFRYAKSARI
ncbi:MAG TPA: hypothetical protein IAC81_02405 [Candidatus Scatomorpha stercorigallinarum]|nr:hypothetical protein [Candidatus Scatomorpha stercorigallinarum]